MAGWLEDLWGKASGLFGKASEAVDEAVDDAQEEKDSREREAEQSLKRVETRQRRQAEQERRRTEVRRKQMPPAEFQEWQTQERARRSGGEDFEADVHELRPEGWTGDWSQDERQRAADQSLREVGRRQGQPQVGEPAREPDGERRATGGDRTNEEIKETLEAIREILEESKNILMEIKEKEPGGATYGP